MLGKLTITREDSTFCGIAIAGIEAVARGESGSRPHGRLTQTRWKKSNRFQNLLCIERPTARRCWNHAMASSKFLHAAASNV
jgi:hypothetical protein